MKIKYLLFFICGALAASCSKDLGNYDYQTLDKVTIKDIEGKYSVILGDSLVIIPDVSHSLEVAESDMSYVWEIDGKVVGETKDLRILLENIPYGSKLCRYTIHNTANGTKTYFTFNVNVESAFSWGYYFLTERDDHSTEISYMPAIVKEGEELTFRHTSSVETYELGDNPRQITGSFGNIQELDDYYWTMIIVTRDGQYPMIVADNSSFMPKTIVSDQNFMDAGSGYSFKPDYIDTSLRSYLFISEGEAITYNRGLLYRPAIHAGNYYWSHPYKGETGSSQYFVLDQLTDRYYVIKPEIDDPVAGTQGDPYAYDRVVSLGSVDSPVPDFAGHVIMGALPDSRKITEDDQDVMVDLVTIVSGDSDGLHFTELSMYTSQEKSIPNNAPRTTFSNVTDIDADSKAVLVNTDWYVSAGSKIYTSPTILPVFTEFVILDSDLGGITSIQATALETNLVVTTYNPASAAEKKGSVVFIDLQTNEVTVHREKIGKCVSFLCANASPWWEGSGDDK